MLQANRRPPASLLTQLVRAWGNEAWSADTGFLESILYWFPRTSGQVLECGSGLSTLILASLARVHDRQVRSLEHEHTWAKRVNDALPPQVGSNVEVRVATIAQYPEFDWYARGGVDSLAGIGLIVCDGPPGSTRGGRYGLAPMMKDRLAPGCIVILDDSHRPAEHSIIERWCCDLSASVIHDRNTHTILRVGLPQ
jgi:hypothetical protein